MDSHARAARAGTAVGTIIRGIVLGLLLTIAVIGLLEIPQDVLVFRYEEF